MFVSQTTTHVLVHCPAKLNLFLEVLARRADGFHEIETLMAGVTLFDTLEFAPRSGETLRLTCRWAGGLEARALRLGYSPGDLPAEEDNLVYRAVARLRAAAGVAAGADIRLTKRIPAAAGLGGASSDAAAALVAANLGWNLGLTWQQLGDVAAELGSDIPFFLQAGWAVCRGRGERIESACGGRLQAVIARPPAGLATAEVYRRCRPAAQPAQAAALCSGLAQGNLQIVRRRLHNRLEEAAMGLSPWIERLKRGLADVGCVTGQMTGSGSSCFGICHSARHARRAAAQLRGRNVGLVYQTTTLAGSRSAIDTEQTRRPRWAS